MAESPSFSLHHRNQRSRVEEIKRRMSPSSSPKHATLKTVVSGSSPLPGRRRPLPLVLDTSSSSNMNDIERGSNISSDSNGSFSTSSSNLSPRRQLTTVMQPSPHDEDLSMDAQQQMMTLPSTTATSGVHLRRSPTTSETMATSPTTAISPHHMRDGLNNNLNFVYNNAAMDKTPSPRKTTSSLGSNYLYSIENGSSMNIISPWARKRKQQQQQRKRSWKRYVLTIILCFVVTWVGIMIVVSTFLLRSNDINNYDSRIGNALPPEPGILPNRNNVGGDMLPDLKLERQQQGKEMTTTTKFIRHDIFKHDVSSHIGRQHHHHHYPRTVFYSTEPTTTDTDINNDHQKRKNDNTNQVIALDSAHHHHHHHNRQIHDPMLHVTPGEEPLLEQLLRQPYITEDGTCVPMTKWQTSSFPNCNSLHELDLGTGLVSKPLYYDVRMTKNNKNDDAVIRRRYGPDKFTLLGKGWFRHTWKVELGGVMEDEAVVLKTLRLEREFFDEFYDLHRRDAVAMERLTHSPFVMNIYGYCGQSALNELADFGKEGTVANLETLARSLRDKNIQELNRMKLQLATMISLGVAHVHEIDYPNNATMAHYDINPRNIAIVKAGKPKLNDFNVAEFLRWDVKNNKPCGFVSRFHEPWWRAPEEMISPTPGGVVDVNRQPKMINEKVDVYALGNLLHVLLTGHSPRGKMWKSRVEEVRDAVIKGEPPKIPEVYLKSKDPSVKAFLRAMKMCFQPNPEERSTAREVANSLFGAFAEIKKQKGKEKKR